tara:strand:- start:142745 stop:143641 length:897 start_codon:yes stop_codon:yes gene_type:complete
VTRCELSRAYGFEESWDWAQEVLESGAYPDLDAFGLVLLVDQTASREMAHRAYQVMSDEAYLNDQYVFDYDRLALKYDLPLLTEVMSKRRHAYALREDVYAPLSLDVLGMLEAPLMTSQKAADGTLENKVLSRPEPEQMLDYARRRLEAAPYAPQAWTNLLTSLMSTREITALARAEPYRINAVVYDNHSAASLKSYLMSKFYDYDAYKKVLDGTFPAEALALFEDMEEDAGFLCPMIRAARLHDDVCAQRKQIDCDLFPELFGALASIEADTKACGVCAKERSLPVSALVFSPMSPD